MTNSLSSLVENLAQGIEEIKFTNHNMCWLEYTNDKDDLIEQKCLFCNKKNLLLKKDVYPYEYMNNFKDCKIKSLC